MSRQQPRPRMSAAERRAQLIEVAQHVFAAKGVNGTTVEELAHEAGITKPLIYEHFGGKEGLYAKVVEGAKRDLVTRLTEAVSGDGTTQEKLERATYAVFTFIQERPDAFRTLIRDAPGPDGASKVATIDELSSHLEHLFAAELTASGRDAAPARAYAFLLLGNVTLVGEWWLERGQSYDREQVSEAMVNVLCHGIGDIGSLPTWGSPEDT